MDMRKATYQRPVEGELWVRLADETMHPATDDDLAKFGLVDRDKLYARLEQSLEKLIGGNVNDLVQHPANYIRYWLEREVAQQMPFVLSHTEPPAYEEDMQIIDELRDFLTAPRMYDNDPGPEDAADESLRYEDPFDPTTGLDPEDVS